MCSKEQGQQGFQLGIVFPPDICSICSEAIIQHCGRGEQLFLTGLEETRFSNISRHISNLPTYTDRPTNGSIRQQASHEDSTQSSSCWISIKSSYLMQPMKIRPGSETRCFTSWPYFQRLVPWMEWHSAGSRVGRTLLTRRVGPVELPQFFCSGAISHFSTSI